MNGVHDMGGMHGMGPIQIEKNEPVFHAHWEGRVFAMYRALWGTGKFGGPRAPIESIPAPEYLRMNYYEQWFTALVQRVVTSGLVTKAEVDSGRPAQGSSKSNPSLTAAEFPAWALKGRARPSQDVSVAPLFKVGDRVRARNINPVTHTRLPRYARGKVGTIERDHGVFVFPDTGSQRLGPKSQHVYSVQFMARELWGEEAKPLDTVCVAMWDGYLEHA
jgi:nitrile hydratase subunit beta